MDFIQGFLYILHPVPEMGAPLTFLASNNQLLLTVKNNPYLPVTNYDFRTLFPIFFLFLYAFFNA